MFGVQGAFLIWHGMSQTACLMVSLVDGSGRIEHLRLDRQQLAARPLQVPFYWHTINSGSTVTCEMLVGTNTTAYCLKQETAAANMLDGPACSLAAVFFFFLVNFCFLSSSAVAEGTVRNYQTQWVSGRSRASASQQDTQAHNLLWHLETVRQLSSCQTNTEDDQAQQRVVVLQARVMHECAAKVLVDSKTGQIWKKDQVGPQAYCDCTTTACKVDVLPICVQIAVCYACSHASGDVMAASMAICML